MRVSFGGLLFFAIVSLALPTQAALHRQVLIKLTNDRNSDVNQLTGLVDKSSTAKGLEVSVINSAGQTVNTVEFSLAQIASPQGAVLATDAGRAVVIIQGAIDAKLGGKAVLKYLTNVITGNYVSCRTEVRRASDGTWHILNGYTGEPVSRGHIQTWTLGISAIKGVCPEQTWLPEESLNEGTLFDESN